VRLGGLSMYYNVVALRTDGSGFSNVTAGIDDQSKAASQADTLNLGSLYVMGADRPGAERAIPDVIYSAGYGPEILDAKGGIVPPYHGEISHSTAQVLRIVTERIEKYGADGVVRFNAFDAAQKVASVKTLDDRRTALAGVFDQVRTGADILEKAAVAKPGLRPGQGPGL